MSTPLTFEVVLFKLKPGVEERQLIEAADGLMPDLRSMPGYVSRELLKGENGQWLDLVHWNSLEDAHRAAQEIMQRPALQALSNLLDESTVTILHLTQARSYGG